MRYKVVRYLDYGTAQICQHTWYCRWYWQANLYSWLWYHLLGFSCAIYKKNPEK